jgi:hypothetical protein
MVCSFLNLSLNDSKALTKHIILGEASNESFKGINLSDAATDSNFIRSNGNFIAVS